jgi:hypothetical protein
MTHVDLRGVDEYNITTLPVDKAIDVQAKLAAAGMRVCMFGSPIGKIDVLDDLQIDLDKLTHLSLLVPIFGTNKVRMFSYHNKKDVSAKEFAALAIERVGKLKEHAKGLGLQLYHENEKGIFGERLAETLMLLKNLRDGKTFFGTPPLLISPARGS